MMNEEGQGSGPGMLAAAEIVTTIQAVEVPTESTATPSVDEAQLVQATDVDVSQTVDTGVEPSGSIRVDDKVEVGAAEPYAADQASNDLIDLLGNEELFKNKGSEAVSTKLSVRVKYGDGDAKLDALSQLIEENGIASKERLEELANLDIEELILEPEYVQMVKNRSESFAAQGATDRLKNQSASSASEHERLKEAHVGQTAADAFGQMATEEFNLLLFDSIAKQIEAGAEVPDEIKKTLADSASNDALVRERAREGWAAWMLGVSGATATEVYMTSDFGDFIDGLLSGRLGIASTYDRRNSSPENQGKEIVWLQEVESKMKEKDFFVGMMAETYQEIKISANSDLKNGLPMPNGWDDIKADNAGDYAKNLKNEDILKNFQELTKFLTDHQTQGSFALLEAATLKNLKKKNCIVDDRLLLFCEQLAKEPGDNFKAFIKKWD